MEHRSEKDPTESFIISYAFVVSAVAATGEHAEVEGSGTFQLSILSLRRPVETLKRFRKEGRMKPNVGEGLEKERDGINLPLFRLLLPLSKNFKRQNCMDRCKDNCTYGHTSRETQKKKMRQTSADAAWSSQACASRTVSDNSSPSCSSNFFFVLPLPVYLPQTIYTATTLLHEKKKCDGEELIDGGSESLKAATVFRRHQFVGL